MEEENVDESGKKVAPYMEKELERMAADINCNRMKARPRFKKKVLGE